MGVSTIQWTDRTEQPWSLADSLANYCVKVSPACKFCYAEVMSRRLAGISKTTFVPYQHMAEAPKMQLRQHVIDSWAKRKKSYKNFVTSMSDVFLEIIPDEWIFKVLDGMVNAPLQIFQILTKRPERMLKVTDAYCSLRGIHHLPKNIWLMITVENQATFNERIPFLMKCKCFIKGLSCEPLLGPLDLTDAVIDSVLFNPMSGIFDLPEIPHPDLGKINWVITGGESGNKKGIRPSHPDWFRSLRDQCAKYETPFFFKQWGTYYTDSYIMGTGERTFRMFDSHQRWVHKGDTWVRGGLCISIDGRQCYIGKDFEECAYPVVVMDKVGTKKAGNLLDGQHHLGFPTVAERGFIRESI